MVRKNAKAEWTSLIHCRCSQIRGISVLENAHVKMLEDGRFENRGRTGGPFGDEIDANPCPGNDFFQLWHTSFGIAKTDLQDEPNLSNRAWLETTQRALRTVDNGMPQTY